MDAEHFDTLILSFTTRASRRGVLAGLASGLLAVAPLALGGDAAEARKKRRKKKKRKPTRTCKSGTERCQGQCLPRCPSGQVRNPLTCGCCQSNNGTCNPPGFNADCCSGICTRQEGYFCSGRGIAESCDFSAQCASEFCNPAGFCSFAAP